MKVVASSSVAWQQPRPEVRPSVNVASAVAPPRPTERADAPANPSPYHLRILALILTLDALLGAVIACKIHFESPALEYQTAALEMAATHRISSTFLPVGLSAMGGLGTMLFSGRLGLSIVAVLLSLALIASAWLYLASIGVGLRARIGLVLALSIYPDYLLSYNKFQDINVSAFILFIAPVLLLRILPTRRISWADFAWASLLAYAVLVRPNMLTLLPASLLLFVACRVPRALRRVVLHAALAASMYALATLAIHGRPFFPHNGPYNLCAGANANSISNLGDMENSLTTVLAQQGIMASSAQWVRNPDLPGYPDVRDEVYNPIYLQVATGFIRSHPGAVVKLAFWKLAYFMQPDFKLHRLPSLGGWIKALETLALPLWILGALTLHRRGGARLNLILAVLIVSYILPFLLTVSGPRFRVPLDLFCWVDLGAMLAVPAVARWSHRTQSAHREYR